MDLRYLYMLNFFLIVDVVLVKSGPIFTQSSPKANWTMAKSNCEALGQHLAVLDSAEKQAALEEQITLDVHQPWIGLYDKDDNDVHVWLTGGNLSGPGKYDNWDSPTSSYNCGYLQKDGKWGTEDCDLSSMYICEWNECEAGYYKTNTTLARCDMCTGNTIKTAVGDAINCDADPPCDGKVKVPNSNHTACVCVGENPDVTYKRRVFRLEEENSETRAENMIQIQVVSVLGCGLECTMTCCTGFSFHDGQCSLIISGNVTHLPLEGAKSYIIQP